MRNKLNFTAVFTFAFLIMCSAPAWTQTDVALSLDGAFSQKQTSAGVAQSPANSAGGMFELSHISNPIVGFEATYSFNRANQTYSSTLGINCPINPPTPCPPPPATVAANAHEVTVDWVPSIK